MSSVRTVEAPHYGERRGRRDEGYERSERERDREPERDGGHRYERQGRGGRGYNEPWRNNGHRYTQRNEQWRNDQRSNPRHGKKPTDASITRVSLGPDGHMRKQIFAALESANLGNLPSGGLLTDTGAPKMYADQVNKVSKWINGHIGASNKLMEAKYSEMAIAFVHLVRAVTDAGLYNQLVALLVGYLAPRAEIDYQARH